MEYDQLTCAECGQQWQRPKARGRKPKLCPTCLQALDLPTAKIVYSSIEHTEKKTENVSVDKPLKYQPNTEWKCHTCGAYVKICIAINEPPSHSCSKRLKKVYDLELIK